MGGFYGSVHCRTEDREEVVDAVRHVARKTQTRFLVGPPIAGWVTVYPESGGQDQRVSKALAKRLSCPLLHVLVHDDDLLAYDYYRDGRLADQFNSCPDYFGEVSSREKRKLQGHPDLLAEFLTDESRLDELRELLTQERSKQPVFAVESLQRFADLLGLPNAVTSYEYLQDGERDDIQGWDQFVHVPDRSAERARERAAKEAQQRSKDDGLLLVEEFGQGSGAATTFPRVCAAPSGDGFLVFWGDSASRDQRPLWLHRSPAFTPREDTGLRLASTVYRLALSHSGRFLGVGHASGNWYAEVWDLASRSRVAHLPVQRAVEWLGFSPDDRHVITLSEGEFRITELTKGDARSFAAPREGRAGIAIHPAGTLVVGDGAGCLTLMDIPSGEVQKRLFVGGKRDLGPLIRQRATLARQQLGVMQTGDWERELREKFRTEIEKMKAMWRTLGPRSQALPPGMDLDKLIETMEKNLEDTIARMKQQMEQAAETSSEEPPEASLTGTTAILCLEISRDGHWVACGTAAGVEVFAWDEILRADEVPVPRHTATTPTLKMRGGGVPMTMPGYTHAVAFDEAGQHLLFAGEEGVVRDLDLQTGIATMLLDPPVRLGVIQMVLSGDRRGLCCVCRQQIDRRHGPPVLQIWDRSSLDELRLRLAPGP